MFTSDPDILREGAVILRILALYYVPFSLMWVFSGIIRGAGDTFYNYADIYIFFMGYPFAPWLSTYQNTHPWGVKALDSNGYKCKHNTSTKLYLLCERSLEKKYHSS